MTRRFSLQLVYSDPNARWLRLMGPGDPIAAMKRFGVACEGAGRAMKGFKL